MNVSTNTLSNTVHTTDEQGLIERSLIDLIAHAANRYASRTPGAAFFLSMPKG